jgi:hypothetical protein
MCRNTLSGTADKPCFLYWRVWESNSTEESTEGIRDIDVGQQTNLLFSDLLAKLHMLEIGVLFPRMQFSVSLRIFTPCSRPL